MYHNLCDLIKSDFAFFYLLITMIYATTLSRHFFKTLISKGHTRLRTGARINDLLGNSTRTSENHGSCRQSTFQSKNSDLFKKMSTEATKKYDTDEFYNVVLKLTKNCGQLIKERTSSRTKKVDTKSGAIDFVTETDQEVERLLIEGLSNTFPDHKFIGEESVSSGAHCDLTDAPTWIIDPVDGTMNFVHSFPHSCISIALFINKLPEIGIIYNPMLDQLFTARKGKGAYLNGEKITVSGTKKLEDSLLMMEFGTSRDPDKRKVILENQQKLMPQVHGLRALGSAALNMAMVACGASDAYFEYGIHIWDIAAGEMIITEAGGVVIDPAGGEVDRLSRRVLGASSQELADQLAKTLVQFYPERD